jgi:starvation-inducible outer membrane lipoprotein
MLYVQGFLNQKQIRDFRVTLIGNVDTGKAGFICSFRRALKEELL